MRWRRGGELTWLSVPISGQARHQMFVDLESRAHYLPQEKVESRLAEIANTHLALAEAAWTNGDLEEAERCAGIAFCADDRKYPALVIKGAIRRRQGNRAGEQLMASIASAWIEERDFTALVDRYCPTMSGASAAAAVGAAGGGGRVGGDLLDRLPSQEIALRPAKALVNATIGELLKRFPSEEIADAHAKALTRIDLVGPDRPPQ